MINTTATGKELSSIFTVNKAVEIEVRGNDSIDHYRSSVSDIDGEIVALAMPMRSTNYVLLEEGSRVVVSATRRDALYAVRVRVLSNVTTPIPIVLARMEGELQRLQRRRHVRVEAFFPESHILIQQGKTEEWRVLTATIMSLSCGGLLFRSNENLMPETEVQVTFQLDDGSHDSVRLGARVVRVEEDTMRKPSVYFVGCAFTSMPALVERRITSFVFRKQIEMRRRGLL